LPKRKKRCITAEDLYNLQLILGCTISPDGNHIAFSVQRVDKKAEKRYSNLWMVPADRGRAWQFTHGNQSDSQPQWSPDGSKIAFISNRGNAEQAQIYIIPLGGGEARQLTNLKGTIGSFEWSPDGKQIVCMFRMKDKEAIEREEDEQKKKLGVVSRQIRRVSYKLDGVGFLPKEHWHIWITDTSTGKSKQLTYSDVYSELSPHWSPDGKEIVFCSNRSEDPDLIPWAIDLFVMPVSGGELRKIEAPVGPKSMPTFSPDGKWLAYCGYEGMTSAKQTCLWVVPVDGSRKAQNLTEKFDFHIAGSVGSDVRQAPPGATQPAWSSDGKRLYFQIAHHGNVTLKSLSLDGDKQSLQTVIGDEGALLSFNFDREQSKLAYLHGDVKNPGEIWVRNTASGRPRQITRISEALLQTIDLGEVEEVWFKGASDNSLQGWILKPPGFDKSRKYPSILTIHGGPQAQYGNLFMHEFYYLATQGYIVFFTNPRGGTGYGGEHLKAIMGNWGTVDYTDLMAWADFVEKKPYIDQERMGVTGGSYGGFMTNWIIGHTDRFKAAVTQRSISNMISLYGSSDINWHIQLMIASEPPWENFEDYWQQSPLKYVSKTKTPTLIIHSEQDLRCPIEQGEQLFLALKKMGIDTEMVLFPDEPHGISQGGRTDRRIERLNQIQRWFDRYLKGE